MCLRGLFSPFGFNSRVAAVSSAVQSAFPVFFHPSELFLKLSVLTVQGAVFAQGLGFLWLYKRVWDGKCLCFCLLACFWLVFPFSMMLSSIIGESEKKEIHF